MTLGKHYLRMREHYADVEEAEECSVTLDELAVVLDCTRRNVMLLLNRMSAENWLQWHPKSGRGNRSVLIFLLPAALVSLALAKRLVERKNLRGALDFINAPLIPQNIKEDFNSWLYRYFGYTTEIQNERKLDTLRFPLSGPLMTFDPMHTNFASESHLVRQIFDNLLQYNALTQNIEPQLAHAWEVDATQTRWTFYLRKGVLFHHGREMTADDVHYSLIRPKQVQERSLFGWMVGQMKEIEVIDPTTIMVELERPNALFLPFLSTTRAVILPRDASEMAEERFGKAPIGSGPFKLISNDHSMCVLEVFPQYFQGRAHLDRVEIWNVPNLYEQGNAEQAESFQIIHNVRRSEQDTTPLHQVKRAGTSFKFITFNSLKTGPLENKNLRQAIRHIVASKEMVRELHIESLAEAYGFYSDGNDVEHKDLLLSDLGGERLELCTIPHYEQDALCVQKLCRRAGVNLHITLLSPEEFKSSRRLEADLILFALVLDNDAELRLIDLYKSMQLHLKPSIRKKLADDIDAILAEPAWPRRKLLFQSIELYLTEENWMHFLYEKKQKTVYHPSVKGISLDTLGWVQFKDVWFKD